MPAKGPEIDDPVLAAAIQRITDNKPEFQRLDLQFMMMGDELLAVVCNTMAKNTSVKQIFLSNNGIGPAGAKAIGGLLAKNKTILELSLGVNKIGDAGLAEFGKPLASNTTLKSIAFGRNSFTDEAKASLVQIVEGRKGDDKLALSFQA